MILGAVMVPHPPIIVSEIGKGEEHAVQKTIDSYHIAMKTLANWHPDTIVLISPHAEMYRDYFQISPGTAAYGDFGRFQAKSVSFTVQYDKELVDLICSYCSKDQFPAGNAYPSMPNLDHGVMVPLYFMNQYLKDYKLVRIGLSGLPLEKNVQLGRYIQKAASILHRRVAVVASGDLSHYSRADGSYGFRSESKTYNQKIMDVMGHGAFSKLLDFSDAFRYQAGECGHGSFTIMSGILYGYPYHTQCLSFEDTFGVGYGVCIYTCTDPYVKLARNTIQTYVQTKQIYKPERMPDEMAEQKAGAFVSIHKKGHLRGCIGTFIPTKDTIYEEIISNAILACSQDPRFFPVQANELDQLDIHVDVLGTLKPVKALKELNVKKYGILVRDAYGHRGLLLPDLEGVDTVSQQIAIAKQKAGMYDDENISIERFQVERHI